MMAASDVEARLIEAMRVFSWGMAARAAFATDGPWGQMRLEWSDRYAPHEDDAARFVAQAVRTPRPDRAMIARAEEAGAWLGLVPERDRRVMVRALKQLASGRARVDWTLAVAGDPGVKGSLALARVRYVRGLAAIAKALSRGSANRNGGKAGLECVKGSNAMGAK